MNIQQRNEKVIAYLPLVKKLAMIQYKRCKVPLEDLIQEGTIGLMSAIEKFDETKASFGTYAYRRITGAILDYLRSIDHLSRRMRKKGGPSLLRLCSLKRDNTFHNNKGEWHTEPSFIEDNKLESLDEIDNLLSKTTQKERIVLRSYFVEEKSLKQISEEQGYTESNACYLKNDGIRRLQRLYSESSEPCLGD